MTEVTDQILGQAKREFLGREPVVGVGLAGSKLAFLLHHSSRESEAEIQRWAAQRDIGFEISVTGANVPAARR